MNAVAATVPPAPRRCLRCNYNLHGLPDAGNCPECGLAVARSADAAGGELRHAPPGWLASLSWGSRLVLLTPLAGYVYAAYVVPNLARMMSLEAYFGVPAALDLAFAAGLWLLTRPQPRHARRHRAWRWALRLLALVPVAQTISVYLLMAGRAPAFLRNHQDWAILGLVPMPALLFLHLRRLALRVPSRSLAEHCAIVAALGTACFAGAGSGFFVRVPSGVNFAFGVGVLLTLLWCAFEWCGSRSPSTAPTAPASRRGARDSQERLHLSQSVSSRGRLADRGIPGRSDAPFLPEIPRRCAPRDDANEPLVTAW
jgi:hypothetical protein